MRTTTEPRMSFVSLSLPLIPVACHASLFNSVIHALCKTLLHRSGIIVGVVFS